MNFPGCHCFDKTVVARSQKNSFARKTGKFHKSVPTPAYCACRKPRNV